LKAGLVAPEWIQTIKKRNDNKTAIDKAKNKDDKYVRKMIDTLMK
jgi:hypothetical protein